MSRKKQKIPLTDLLRDSIKELRKQYNKRGDVLSVELSKGASYISQLENGKIKEIDFDLIVDIFQRIVELTDTPFNHFLINYMNTLLQNIVKKALLNENWIHLFVMQEIQHPIVDTIIDLIKENLHEYNCSPENLVKKINCNRNSRLSSEYAYEPNKLYVNVSESIGYDNTDYDVYTQIEYRFPPDFVAKILSKEVRTINYIDLHGVMYNIFLLKNEHNAHGALITTEEFLYNNNFLTAIKIYNKFHDTLKSNPKISDNNVFSHYGDLVVNYSNRFQKSKKEVLKEIEYALDQYFQYGQEANTLYKMEEMLKNMSTTTTCGDLGLIMAILSSPIYEIDKSDRDDFWDQYKEILNKFFNYNNK